MSTLFDEAEADIEVNRVLSRRKIIKENRTMALFKGNDGQIYQVINTEVVDRKRLEEVRDLTKREAEAAQADLDAYDTLTAETAPTPEPAPVPEVPVETPAPEVPAPGPIEIPVQDPQPETEATPAEQAAEIAEAATELAQDLAQPEVPQPITVQ